VNAEHVERLAILQAIAVGDEATTRAQAPDLAALEAAVATAERRVEQIMADGAADDLGELWAPEVRRRREAHADALAALGEARTQAGVPATTFRLLDDFETMAPDDLRSALSLFWRDVRVGRRANDGRQDVTFVARGPSHEAEVRR
jgi:hypothetical protein